MHKIHYYTSFIFLLFPVFVHAQSDSLILKNGNVILGEFKQMDRGVLTMETDYSDSDFKIEWNGISEIYSTTKFLVTTSDGKRYNGPLQTVSAGKVEIVDKERGALEYTIGNVVFLKSVDEGFWSRVYASIDFGFSLAKSNNLRQVTMRSNVGYLSERWSLDGNYNTLRSTQNDTEPIRRTDGGVAYKQYLPKDWYVPIDMTFLSNTEQKIDLRIVGRLGLGKYLLHTNNSYWGIAAGASLVNEQYISEGDNKNSVEGYFGSELNLYDIGDLSLMTKAVAYPGITESGRWRSDFSLDTKYDLPLDFYVKLGITFNYDSEPVEGASNSDYVFSTGFGWEL